MALEIQGLAELSRVWGGAPKKGMFIDVVAVARGLRAEPTSDEAVRASVQLAMQLGDTGAQELCVIVAEHRQRFGLAPAHWASLEAHRRLALLDLGLAVSEQRTLPVAAIVQHTIVDPEPVCAFREAFLEPLGGSLDRCVELAIRLCALRVELLDRPRPIEIESVLALAHPADLAPTGEGS